MDKGKIIAVVVGLIVVVCILSQCTEDSEYETAGKDFGSWINTDPQGWSDAERDYFNNFMDWSDNN